MDTDKVRPLRPTPRGKEARLQRLHERFERAHPGPRRVPRSGASAKGLVLALAVAAIMIWLASMLGG